MASANTPQPSRGFIATTYPNQSPLGHHSQSRLPMIPVVYPGPFATGAHYAIDPLPPRHTSLVPLNNHLPVIRPLHHSLNNTGLVTVQRDFPSPRPAQNSNRPDARRQNAARLSRTSYYNGTGHHNHVDVKQIREGTDVRTTVSDLSTLVKYPHTKSID